MAQVSLKLTRRADNGTPPLPPGFILDKQEEAPSLPKGFVLDKQETLPLPEGFVLDDPQDIPPPPGFILDEDKETLKAKRIAEIEATPIDEPEIYGDLIPKVGDVPGIVAKAGAGLLKGATLGAVDPERGTVGIPFTSKRYEYAPPLSESLKEIGVSEEISDNPYIGLPPEIFATIAPWSMVSKGVTALSAGAKIAQSGKVARTLGSVMKGIAKRTAIQATTGGIVGGARVREEDESLLENTLTGAAYAAAINLFAETFNVVINQRKIGAFNKLKDDMAELLYNEGKISSIDEAQDLSAKIISNEINIRGGWDKVTRKVAKKSSDFIKSYLSKSAKQPPPPPVSGVAKVSPKGAIGEITSPQIPTGVVPSAGAEQIAGVPGQITEQPIEPLDKVELPKETLGAVEEGKDVIGDITPPTPAIEGKLTPEVDPSGEGEISKILGEETGAIDIEKIVPGIKAIEDATIEINKAENAVADVFTRFKGLDSTTRQKFINVSESDSILQDMASKKSVDIFQPIIDKPQTWEAIYKHLQQPTVFPSPPETEDVIKKLKDISKWSFKSINQINLKSKTDLKLLDQVIENMDNPKYKVPERLAKKLIVPLYPNNAITKLEFEKSKIELKKNEYVESQREVLPGIQDEKITDFDNQINQIDKQIKRLENVSYFHQITVPEKQKGKVFGRKKSKQLSRRPHGLLGRKFLTRDEAIAEGREVGTLPAAVADTIYITNKTLQMDKFIKSINQNKEFAARSDLAPDDWVKIDERIMPAGKFMKYHPSMAKALTEITYVSDKAELTKAYDKVNSVAKMIGFYNPVMMARYNLSQAFRGGGLKALRGLIPKNMDSLMPEAMEIVFEKGERYNHLKRNGLYNVGFEMQPHIKEITDNMIAEINNSKTLSDEFKKMASNVLSPKKLWETLNKTTWKIDEIERTSLWLAMQNDKRLKRKYSDFEIIELANDFMANYNKVPVRTRQTLNRAIFTPTYKISMARIFGRMHKEAKTLWPSLLRHYAMTATFKVGLPLAVAAFLKSKGSDKRVKTEGYRVIITDPKSNKETVYSISDPVLELAKIENRPWYRTIEYNLAAVPHAIITALRGPLFSSKDPDWKETVNSFFKLGAPGLKELSDWEKEDKETYQKFMQLMGVAYIYQRNKKKIPEEPVIKSVMKAMDLWIDWKKVMGQKEERSFQKRKSIKIGDQ